MLSICVNNPALLDAEAKQALQALLHSYLGSCATVRFQLTELEFTFAGILEAVGATSVTATCPATGTTVQAEIAQLAWLEFEPLQG